MSGYTYTVSKRPALDMLSRVEDYVVAVDGLAVIEHRQGPDRPEQGQPYFMTYRTEQGANIAVERVRTSLPDAEVVKREEDTT